MKDTCVFFLLLFFNIAVFSQTTDADLVFKDGDTIPGFGMIIKNNTLKFRKSLEEEATIYEGVLVKEIIFYGDKEFKAFEFVKTGVKRNPVLMEVLCTGKASLYELKDSYEDVFNEQTTPDLSVSSRNKYVDEVKKNLYLKRKDEVVGFKISKSFKETALQYFKDCNYLKELFNSGEYRNLSKKQIVDEYNVFCTE